MNKNWKNFFLAVGLVFTSAAAMAQQTKPAPPKDVPLKQTFKQKQAYKEKNAKGQNVDVTVDVEVQQGQKDPNDRVMGGAPGTKNEPVVKQHTKIVQTPGAKMSNAEWKKWVKAHPNWKPPTKIILDTVAWKQTPVFTPATTDIDTAKTAYVAQTIITKTVHDKVDSLVYFPVTTPVDDNWEVNLSYVNNLKPDPVRGNVDGIELNVRSPKVGPEILGQKMLRFVASAFKAFGKMFDSKPRCPGGCIIDQHGNVVNGADNVGLAVEAERTFTLLSKNKSEIVEGQIVDGVVVGATYDQLAAGRKKLENLPALPKVSMLADSAKVTPVVATDAKPAVVTATSQQKPQPEVFLVKRTVNEPIIQGFVRARIGANYLLNGLKDSEVKKVGAFDKATYPDKVLWAQDMKQAYEPYRIRGSAAAEAGLRLKLLNNFYLETSIGITTGTLKKGVVLLQDAYTGNSPDQGNSGRFGPQFKAGLTWTPHFGK